jgi:hypothetical protein
MRPPGGNSARDVFRRSAVALCSQANEIGTAHRGADFKTPIIQKAQATRVIAAITALRRRQQQRDCPYTMPNDGAQKPR